MEWQDVLPLGRGGWATLGAWDPQVGVKPLTAAMSIPELGLADVQASIGTDGLARAFVPRGSMAAGTYDCLWTLQLPGAGEPVTIQALTVLCITDVVAPPVWFDAFGIPTAKYMRESVLQGVQLVDRAGRFMPDLAIEREVQGAVDELARDLDMALRPTIFSSIPGFVQPDGEEDTPLVIESGYDYDPSRFASGFSLTRLRRKPVIAVYHYQLFIGDRLVADVPMSWVYPTGQAGDVNLIPSATNTLALSAGGAAFPMLTGAWAGTPIPQLLRLVYKAGRPLDRPLQDVASWMAAKRVLLKAGNALFNGNVSQSVSIDGVSTSTSTAASASSTIYGGAIAAFDAQIKDWMENVAGTYSGPRIVF